MPRPKPPVTPRPCGYCNGTGEIIVRGETKTCPICKGSGIR